MIVARVVASRAPSWTSACLARTRGLPSFLSSSSPWTSLGARAPIASLLLSYCTVNP